MPILHQAIARIRHWLLEVDQHSIHSPYFFEFYQKVMRGETDPEAFAEIEKMRNGLLENTTVIKVEDYGAGSVLGTDQRMLADIASTSISSRKRAELYARIIDFCKARRIVELGSCLGLTTLYLARNKNSFVFTFEGSPALANVSLTNFEYFNQDNIQLIEGNIDSTLSNFLQDPAHINFVLMDANHRYAPTMKYYALLMRRLDEKSIVVIDDIHHSPEMERAWKEIRSSELVYGSVDLFGCGILFFDPSLNRQHFIWPAM